MTKKMRTTAIILVMLLVAVLAFKNSPLYRKVLWHSVALEDKGPFKLSNLSISVPKDWVVLGENTFDYDYGKLVIHFASISTGHVEGKLESIKAVKEKKNIKTTAVTYLVGCKNSHALIEESVVDKTKMETVLIAVDPDILINADFIVDSGLEKRKEVFANFLSKNVSCVESSNNLKQNYTQPSAQTMTGR
jgi:hypothetical protein